MTPPKSITCISEPREDTYPQLSQPLLPLIRLLLTERQIDQLPVAFRSRRERDHMFRHMAEIIACVRVFARSQTLFAFTGTETSAQLKHHDEDEGERRDRGERGEEDTL